MSVKVVVKNWSSEDPVKALELVEKAIDLGAKRAPEIRALMRRYI
jgi:hypothetical protein